jgi:hypothetical protein
MAKLQEMYKDIQAEGVEKPFIAPLPKVEMPSQEELENGRKYFQEHIKPKRSLY